MNINLVGNNPYSYLKKYAQDNNMNVNDAKIELQNQYGNPQIGGMQNQSLFGMNNQDKPVSFMGDVDDSFDTDMLFAQMMQETGITNLLQNIKNFFMGNSNSEQDSSSQSSLKGAQVAGQQNNQDMDPDAYAQQYAEENGISLEEAKAQLRAKYGDPQKPQQ
ncbi:hypothetical protein IJG14_00370 [bacterium]|nr:hypothetical protein [bacterium]